MSKLLALALLVVLTAACNNAGESTEASIVDNETINLEAHRGAKQQYQAVERFSLSDLDASINLETLEAVKMQQMDASNEDAADVMNIHASLMGAEKEAQVLDVNFSMSDEPVGNGMFIFSIESPESKDLTIEMFDEEGYEMAANNEFNVTEGNNYKALNVTELQDGDYLFRLKDDYGSELVRTVSIASDTEK